MMTVPYVFWQMGSFFGCGFNKTLFCLISLVQFFFVGGLALTFRIWTLLEIIPRRKRSTMRKYKYINHFLRALIVIVQSMTQQCVLVNFTMEQWKIDLGKKWFRLRTGWPTTSRNSTERGQIWWAWSEMTEWQYFVSYTFVKSYFSRANFSDGSHAPVCRTLWKTSEPKFKDSAKWTISSGRLGQLFRWMIITVFCKIKNMNSLDLQAVSSSIDYDYFEYARIRLHEYLKLKTEQWETWFEKCLGEWKYIWIPQTLCEIIWIFAHYLSWFSTHHCFWQK